MRFYKFNQALFQGFQKFGRIGYALHKYRINLIIFFLNNEEKYFTDGGVGLKTRIARFCVMLSESRIQIKGIELSRRPWTPEVMNYLIMVEISCSVPWNPQEDELLLKLVSELGLYSWCTVASKLQGRSGKQCSERSDSLGANFTVLIAHWWFCVHLCSCRYKNQLSPDIIKEPWTREEDMAILAAQAQVGNKWTEMWEFLLVLVMTERL